VCATADDSTSEDGDHPVSVTDVQQHCVRSHIFRWMCILNEPISL